MIDLTWKCPYLTNHTRHWFMNKIIFESDKKLLMYLFICMLLENLDNLNYHSR